MATQTVDDTLLRMRVNRTLGNNRKWTLTAYAITFAAIFSMIALIKASNIILPFGISPDAIWVLVIITFLFTSFKNQYARPLADRGAFGPLLRLNDPKLSQIMSASKLAQLRADVRQLIEDCGHNKVTPYIRYKVHKLRLEGYNAFTAGPKEDAILVIELPMANDCPRRGLQGIIAHELGHVTENHTGDNIFFRSILSGFRWFITIFFLWTLLSWPRWPLGVNPNILHGLLVWGVLSFVSIALTLALNFTSRRLEEIADVYTASLNMTDELVEGLEFLAKKLSEVKEGELTLKLRGIWIIFFDHPNILVRVKRLYRLIDGKQGLIKDRLEFFIQDLLLFVIAPIAGGVALAQAAPGNMSIYIPTVLWPTLTLYGLRGLNTPTKKDMEVITPTVPMILGIISLGGLYVGLGYIAINSWQLSPWLMVLWTINWLMSFGQKRWSWMDTIHDKGIYAWIGISGFVIYNLFV